MRTNFRGCKDWIDYGVPLSTTSDEACKLYDAALSQIIGWYEDANFGGLQNTFKKIHEADPDFVMGHVIANSIIQGTSKLPSNDPIRKASEEAFRLADKQQLTDNERKYVAALKYVLEGETILACNTWEEILRTNPLDMLAVKLMTLGYFQRGQYDKLRNCVGSVKQFWKPEMPLYGYLHGIHAFGLHETHMYEESMKVANQGLQINRHDIFSTHAIAHVYEMQGKPNDGLKVLVETENDWNVCQHLACHVYWHNALFQVEKGNFEEGLGIWDSEIITRLKGFQHLGHMADASSFLYRLKFEGVDVKDRFRDLYEASLPLKDKFANSFYDPQLTMAMLGSGDGKVVKKSLETIKEMVRNETRSNRKLSEEIVIPLCEAVVAHEGQDYARAVELMFPIRYDIFQCGGSDAQRDVFNMLLIDAAMKSSTKEHNKIARMLIAERQSMKESSPLTDRMLERFLVLHDAQ